MRVIPVIDLKDGRGVHARGGNRAAYRRLRSVLSAAASDPLALARVFRTELGTPEVYVADLDAITGAGSQEAIVRALVRDGASVWLDAGVRTVELALAAVEMGVVRVIVGLETLPLARSLAEIVDGVGGERVAFSLDLRDRTPIVSSSWDHRTNAVEIAKWAAETGIGALIVLDLARVGSGAGAELELMRSIRAATGGTELVAGGGIRGIGDVRALASVGCDAALVATALHEGAMRGVELAALRGERHEE